MASFYEKLTQTRALKPAFDRAWQFKMWARHVWQAQFPEPALREFMRHNRRKYANGSSLASDAVILIGQYSWNPSMYNYSIVANHLASRTHGRIESFAFHDKRDRITERVFASFGARLALTTGAPVIPACSWREPDGTHVLHFEEPLPLMECEDTSEAIRRNTRAYNAALERMLLAHPEQWIWMHRRWKIKPA